VKTSPALPHRRRRVVAVLAPLPVAALAALSGCGPRSPAAPAGVAVAAPPTGAAAFDGDPIFSDATAASGIGYRWTIAGKRPLTILQTIGNGAAFLDYDNDGNLDLLLVGPKPALYKGDGEGNFTNTSAAAGLDKITGHFLGCAVGDVDNDGFEDVYLSAYRGGALLHNANGKFRDVTAGSGLSDLPWGTSCALGDVNNDGRLDLYVCGYVQFTPGKTQPQLCDYGGRQSACGPRFYKPERGRLFLNAGGNRFRDVTRAWNAHTVSGKGLGATFADYDNSGRQSLAAANDEMAGDLLQNKGGTFTNVGATTGVAYDSEGNVHGGMGVDWGDYDNDAKLDLFVATFQHENKCVYRNESGGFFTESSAALGLAPAVPFVTFGAKWLDYDNDGYLDLILANGHVQDNIGDIDKSASYRQPTQVFKNEAGARFRDVSAQLASSARRPIMGRGLCIGDYDNDGRVDALVVDGEGAPLLLHNETKTTAGWLSCRLVGAKSNRDGVGALVTVASGGIKQTRRCGTDGSYLSASDKRVHFGLGTGKPPASVKVNIKWPSGAKNTYAAVPIGRVVTLREGGNKAE